MQVMMNGQAHDLDASVQNLADLVLHLGHKLPQVAVEQNGVIVRRAALADTAVNEGDRIELVTLVGGG